MRNGFAVATDDPLQKVAMTNEMFSPGLSFFLQKASGLLTFYKYIRRQKF